MDTSGLLRLILLDILTVVGVSLAIGFTAPRWPARWLQRDVGPLRLNRFDRPVSYRRIKVMWLARVLPEGGEWMGGQSKSQLPGRDRASLTAYLVEVRRGEWVHWLSMLAWLPLAFFNPWGLTLAFALVVVLGNAVFVTVLRFNRIRLTALLARSRE
jgi:glycosyl-4,4'-diaponeurosporenoate acyltransferase